MEVRIYCINKSGGYHENPHAAVSHYGWLDESNGNNGIMDRQSMVSWMKNGNKAYVSDRWNHKVYCEIRNKNGVEFLQTVSDGRDSNNLLELNECPIR